MTDPRPIDPGEHWEQVADAWIAWTRRPGHDSFWSYREALRAFLPPPGALTLEVGCGEGRISRELGDLGHRVLAVDLSPALVRAARAAGSAAAYARADAVALPLGNGVVDRVVVYNVLMDLPDLRGAVAEIARVLAPGGTVTVSVRHPMTDRGRFHDGGFLVEGDYFAEEEFRAVEARAGLEMPFASWSRPLSAYTDALHAAGLVLTDLVEPRPAAGDVRRSARWGRVPLFLWFHARHAGQPAPNSPGCR